MARPKKSNQSPEALPTKLALAMERRGVTDSELAALVKAQQPEIWRLRVGPSTDNGRPMTWAWAKRLAPKLGIKPVDLMDDAGGMESTALASTKANEYNNDSYATDVVLSLVQAFGEGVNLEDHDVQELIESAHEALKQSKDAPTSEIARHRVHAVGKVAIRRIFQKDAPKAR